MSSLIVAHKSATKNGANSAKVNAEKAPQTSGTASSATATPKTKISGTPRSVASTSTSSKGSPWHVKNLVTASTHNTGKKATSLNSSTKKNSPATLHPMSIYQSSSTSTQRQQGIESNGEDDDDVESKSEQNDVEDKKKIKPRKSYAQKRKKAGKVKIQSKKNNCTCDCAKKLAIEKRVNRKTDEWEVEWVTNPQYCLAREVIYKDTFFRTTDLQCAKKKIWYKDFKKGHPKKVKRGYMVSWKPSIEFDNDPLVTRFLKNQLPEVVKLLNVVNPLDEELRPNYSIISQ